MVEKKAWRRGRTGFCEGAKALRYTILICPKTLEMVREYTKANKTTVSLTINKAIEYYIKNVK